MRVDQDVVAGDVGVKSSDITDATHIGGQVVNLIDTTPRGLQTAVPATKIENFKLVGLGGLIFGVLNIDTANKAAFGFQPVHESMPDETACAGD